MRATGQIKLRQFDTTSANFTLPILRKSRPLSLYPLSVKKLTGLGWTYDHPRQDDRAALKRARLDDEFPATGLTLGRLDCLGLANYGWK